MFAKIRESIQNKLSSEPIECPRGWGKVGFQFNGGAMMPFLWLARSCPISGSETCSGCGHESNPDAVRLQENLVALEAMRQAGAINEEEFADRRKAVMTLHTTRGNHAGFRIAAWILGPLGLLFGGGGTVLALRVAEEFWVMTAFGAILLALTLSFAALGRKPEDNPYGPGMTP